LGGWILLRQRAAGEELGADVLDEGPIRQVRPADGGAEAERLPPANGQADWRGEGHPLGGFRLPGLVGALILASAVIGCCTEVVSSGSVFPLLLFFSAGRGGTLPAASALASLGFELLSCSRRSGMVFGLALDERRELPHG